jgi:D-glucosaminate-6-phosphate ammonia-lyase
MTYSALGVRPLINALSTYTRLGGSIMPPEVVTAMVEASQTHVNLEELQVAVGRRIAELTHNEAAYVATGAAAGLVLVTAAIVAGRDPERIQQLPDLTGLKNEVVCHKMHRNGYDHAVRSVGVKMVEIGSDESATGAEMEAAINDNTAFAFWTQGAMNRPGQLPLEQFIVIAHGRGLPVLMDAAAQLPPVENLWRFTQMGVDAVVFSGGKDLHGPQASGLILGRQEIIDTCRLHGSPNHAIGRPMKVGKEEMVGLLAAVKWYLGLDHAARDAMFEQWVADWCAALNAIPGVSAERTFPNGAGQAVPRAKVTFDVDRLSITGDEIVQRLLDGDPAIAVAPNGPTSIFLNPYTLQPGEAKIVQDHLLALLQSVQQPSTA